MSVTGLTSAEARQRLENDGPNRLQRDKPRSLFEQVFDVIREPMLLLLVAAAAISFTLGHPLEATILSFSVAVIIGISIFQRRRTDRALAALKRLSAPRARVIRDGLELSVSSEEVVVGDLVAIAEGDRIPADGELLESSNLAVDESNLTGESIAVGKTENDEVYSSTLVVRGHALLMVTTVGEKSRVGQIGILLAHSGETRSPLQREIDSIVRVVAVLAILSAISVAVTYGATRGDFLTGALAGVAAAMALLPEELPIVLTVFMGLGALRLSKKRVIVRNSPAIETLGSLTVLCVDKTGTITENRMEVTNTDSLVLRFGALASQPRSFDPMDKAFLDSFQAPADWKLIREYPLTSNQLAVCQVWDNGSDQFTVALKGAPETVIRLCRIPDSEIPTEIAAVDLAAKQGNRILAVASAEHPRETALPDEAAHYNFDYLGLATLTDPVRAGVPDAVTNLRTAGIRTIMITGDFPGTAVAIARQIDLTNPDSVLTGEQVSTLTDDELIVKLSEVSVFSRMLPEQKLRLVDILQRMGEIVGMTGDGVNDAPALKRAHVGIAMGERGSEVAREASDLVITDDSFVSVAGGVAEGRRIYANLRRAAAYIIAIHVPIFGLALLPLANPLWPLILLPAQIAMLEILIDPAASVAYQAERPSRHQMQARPRATNEKLISRGVLIPAVLQGLALFAATAGVFLWGTAAGLSEGAVRLLSFTTLLSGNLMLMMTNRSNSEPLHQILKRGGNAAANTIFSLGFLLLAAIHLIQPLQQAFRFDAVDPTPALWAAAAGILPLVLNEARKIWMNRARGQTG